MKFGLLTVLKLRIVGILSLVILCLLDCSTPDPSSFQEVMPIIVLQLCQIYSTCEDTLLGQGHLSNIELDTENWFVRSGAVYFPTAGAEPKAFGLPFLNTSKTGWGCSQNRQTVGLVPVSWGNPENSGWVLRAEYPLWPRTRKAWLPSSPSFQHNQEYEEVEWKAREIERAAERRLSVTLKQNPHAFFHIPHVQSLTPSRGLPTQVTHC